MNAFKLTSIFTVVLLAFSGCNSDSDPGSGTLSVTLTDAPFPIESVAEANVTIQKIEIRRDSTEQDNPPFTVLSEQEASFNLLDLQNGVKASLVDLEVEAGSYDLVRLQISEASVKLTDDTVFDLTVPSGAQSGLKIFIDPSIVVSGGLSAELMLDFNVSQSFVVQGGPDSPGGIKGFKFKPTLKAVNTSTAGRIEGTVSDTSGTALENIQVAVFAEGDTSFAYSEADGFYSIISLDAGTYSVEATSADYDTLSVPEVEITAGNSTTTDLSLTPVATGN